MLKRGIFLIVVLYCTSCHAQCDSINDSSANPFNLRLSYNSTVIYPGMSAGIEYSLKNVNVQLFRNHKPGRAVRKGKYISGNLNWYHHPDFHDNLYLTVEWVMRRTRFTGLISEFSAGPGFSRTFLGGTTYKVDNAGNISVIKLAGYNYALVTLGGGFGYDFSMVKQLPFSTVAKLNIISMFPYNSTIYFRPVFEFGIRYTPGKFVNNMKKKPVTISKY
ncbi:MAG: hypothetical protein WA816_00010 [Bacteroidales bacterium]